MTCPICTQRHTDIEDAMHVCEAHRDGWFVIYCKQCGRLCYSDSTELCLICQHKVTQPERVFDIDNTGSAI